MNYVYSRYMLLSEGHKGRFICNRWRTARRACLPDPAKLAMVTAAAQSAIRAPIKFTYR